jgi:hypothetical protein
MKMKMKMSDDKGRKKMGGSWKAISCLPGKGLKGAARKTGRHQITDERINNSSYTY